MSKQKLTTSEKFLKISIITLAGLAFIAVAVLGGMLVNLIGIGIENF